MQSVTISHSKACQSFVVLIGMVCIIMHIFKLKCFKQSQSEACMVKIEFRKCTLLPKGGSTDHWAGFSCGACWGLQMMK